jgi:hypothetical protein
MDQRSDTAAQRALLAEDLGRQLRALFFLTLAAKLVRGIARIGRWISNVPVSAKADAGNPGSLPLSGVTNNNWLHTQDPYLDTWMERRILAWNRETDQEDGFRSQPEFRPAALQQSGEVSPALPSANDDITKSAA